MKKNDFVFEEHSVDMINNQQNELVLKTMSDDELDKCIKMIENEEDGLKLVKSYLFGKANISLENYRKLQDWIEKLLLEKNPLFELKGPLYEELKFNKEQELMQCDVSELYTITEVRYDTWMEDFVPAYRTTPGWNKCARIPGFEEAFKKFFESFKQTRNDLFEQKMQEFKKAGITTSKLILLQNVEGFSKEIEIKESLLL